MSLLKNTPFFLLVIAQWVMAQIYPIDTIFVTASRVTAQIEKLPVATTIIPEEIIRLKTFGDFTNLFLGEEGIDFRGYSFLKGLASLSIFGSTSQQVLVLLDGIPFYSPSTGIADLGLISSHNLKRIEVVKGAISSLYGANALGGVVNFVTKSPFEFKPKRLNLESNLLYGSFRTSNISFASGLNLRDEFGFGLSLHREKTKGFRSNEDAIAQGANLSFNLSENLKLNLGYESKNVGVPGPKPPKDTVPQYGDSTATSLLDREVDNQYLIAGEIVFPIAENLKITGKPFFRFNQTNFQWVDLFSLDTVVYQDTYITKVAGGSLILLFSSAKLPLRLAGGADFRWDNFWTHSYFYDLSTWQYRDTVYNPKSSKVGLFWEGNFCQRPSLSPSLRYDWDIRYGKFFSPSLGIVYPFSFGKFRLHLGRAFRAPTFNDLYWPRSGNLSLKPEVGWTAQIGFDLRDFSLTFFFRRVKDLIAWLPDTGGLWRPTNVNREEAKGLEWRGRAKIIDGIFFSLSGEMKKADIIRKEMVYRDSFAHIKRRTPFLPQIKLSPALLFAYSNTNLHLEGNFTGDKVNYYPADDSLPKVYMKEKRLPPYFLLGIRLKQKIGERFLLIFKIENIFDVAYAEVFGNKISDRDYPRPGRIFFLGMEVKN